MAPRTRRWLILIVLAGAVLRLFPIWFGLPYPQARPDEETAIGKALDALNDQPNPRFFHWPSLTFYVFAGVLWTARALHGLIADARHLAFAEQAIVTRAVVAIAGTATILVLFRLARRVAGDRVALIASAFLAVAILHVRESHFAMTDALMTLLLWSALLALFTALETSPGRVGPWAAAGLLGGLATSTKYNAGAVAFAMIAAQMVLFARSPRDAASWRGWLPMVAFGASMVAAFLLGTPYAVLDAATFRRDLEYDFTHLAEGHRGIMLGRGWIYHLTHSLPYGVGIPVFVAGLAGFVPLARHHRTAAVVLGAFAAVFYYTIGSGYTVFFRYVLPLVPLLCLTAAVTVSRVGEWMSVRWRVPPAAALAAVLLVTLAPSLVQSAWFDLLLARTDTRVLAGRWLEARIRPGESLHDAGSPYTRLDLWRATFDRWEFDEAANEFIARAGRTPDWLVLYGSPLTTYVSMPAALRQLAQSEYVLVYSARATTGPARLAMYDRQDAFFLPFSRFTTVVRPGPSVFIYRRGDLAGVGP